MGWNEAIKDVIAVAQQADNVPLVRELIDAQKQILDLIEENQRLRAQVKELQETSDISEKIVRHEDAYITLKDDPQNLIYCSCCWDTQRILVQGQKTGVGTYTCPSCGTNAYYDRNASDRHQQKVVEEINYLL